MDTNLYDPVKSASLQPILNPPYIIARVTFCCNSCCERRESNAMNGRNVKC